MSAIPSTINSMTRFNERRRIVSALAKTSTLVVYEVPAGKTLRIESMSVCNVATTTATFRLHVVGANESIASSNAVYYDNPLRGNATLLDDSIRYLNAGDRIAIRSDTASAIVVQIHGVEE
jgi:hypothetical protein